MTYGAVLGGFVGRFIRRCGVVGAKPSGEVGLRPIYTPPPRPTGEA